MRASVRRALGGMLGPAPMPSNFNSTPARDPTPPQIPPQPLETPSAPKCAGPAAPARMPWARGAVASPSAFLLSTHSTTRGGESGERGGGGGRKRKRDGSRDPAGPEARGSKGGGDTGTRLGDKSEARGEGHSSGARSWWCMSGRGGPRERAPELREGVGGLWGGGVCARVRVRVRGVSDSREPAKGERGGPRERAERGGRGGEGRGSPRERGWRAGRAVLGGARRARREEGGLPERSS